MKRQEKYKDTAVFTYYNANPKNKITGDCVVRAVCVGLNKKYEDVLKGLYDSQLKTGYMLNDKKNVEKYLKELGYEKQKQPRQIDNTKYTGAEFCEQIARAGYRYIVSIGGHHMAAIANKKIYDIWNSSSKSVGVYWVIKEI